MKNFVLLLCICLFGSNAFAQELTGKDIQGKWKLVAYSLINGSLDVTTGKATINDTYKKTYPELAVRLASDLESYAENLKIAYLEIEGNHFMQVIFDSVKAGPFTIENKNGQQIMNISFDSGGSGSVVFSMNNGYLTLNYPASARSYTYKKE